MSIIYTTAFKNIRRDLWETYSRSVNEYVQNFLRMCSVFPHHLVVYIEDDILQFLNTIQIPFQIPQHIIFKNAKSVDTFYDRYVEREKEVMKDERYKNKIPQSRRSNPEHLPLGYNAVMHNKVNFLSSTCKTYPNFEHYGWIDFGYLKGFLGVNDLPLDINYSKLNADKITFGVMVNPPENRISPDDMLTEESIFFHGASFIVPKKLVFEYEKIYEKKVLELYDQFVSDDDQNIIYQIYYDHKDMFQYFKMSGWMKLYNDHLNLKKY
jgi:hypothetical protein